MSLPNLKTDSNIQDETDSLGSAGTLDSAVYPMKVTMAYFGKSKGGATSVDLHLKAENGRELKQTLWVASGDAKGNKNYYETKDGEKKYLPGFNLANSLCLLTVGKELGDLAPEEKTVALYSYEDKKDVMTKVQMLTDLIGQDILAGVLRQTVDKNVKDGAGNYVPSGETRDENEIDKFFRAKDRMTTFEIRNQLDATFADNWEKKWTGVTRDKSTKGAIAPPSAAGAGPKPTNSLFNSPA